MHNDHTTVLQSIETNKFPVGEGEATNENVFLIRSRKFELWDAWEASKPSVLGGTKAYEYWAIRLLHLHDIFGDNP